MERRNSSARITSSSIHHIQTNQIDKYTQINYIASWSRLRADETPSPPSASASGSSSATAAPVARLNAAAPEFTPRSATQHHDSKARGEGTSVGGQGGGRAGELVARRRREGHTREGRRQEGAERGRQGGPPAGASPCSSEEDAAPHRRRRRLRPAGEGGCGVGRMGVGIRVLEYIYGGFMGLLGSWAGQAGVWMGLFRVSMGHYSV
jgi:hypothetical protein